MSETSLTVELDPEKIEEKLIDRMVAKLFEVYVDTGKVRLAIESALAEKAEEVIAEEAVHLIANLVTSPQPWTDEFGQAVGPAKSLLVRLKEFGVKFLMEKTNSSGSTQYDGKPRIQWVVYHAVADLAKEAVDESLKDVDVKVIVKEAIEVALLKRLPK